MTPPAGRTRASLAIAGMMAAALGMGASPVLPAASGSGSSGPSREFIVPAKTRRRKRQAPAKKPEKADPPGTRFPRKRRKAERKYVGETRSQPWRRFKDGSAIDGRGDYRSAKRLLRLRMAHEFGVTSGRQWVRVRRLLRVLAKRHAGRAA